MNYKLTIGIDASRANEEFKTGVGSYAYHVIQEFKKILNPKSEIINGNKFSVVLYSREPLKGELGSLPDNWQSKVLHWPPKKFWTQIRLSWEMLFHRPDVLFIPAHVFPLIHPKKTVMMVHDVVATQFPSSYSRFERWYSVWSARFAVKKLWKVITPSGFVKTEIKKQETRNKKQNASVFVVYHGYDEKYKRIEDKNKISEVLDKYKIKKPFIMTVGRLEEKKNTKRIVEAFNIFKKNYSSNQAGRQLPITNYQLFLIGMPGHGYAQVQSAINASPYKQDIITPGWVDDNDLPYLMNAAEVFVFPSLSEGFGLPVLEAMACGTPVVASRGTSLEEVGGEALIYVNPENVEEIASGIKNLIEDKKLREEKITAGLERVKQFSWEKCARETWEILIDD